MAKREKVDRTLNGQLDAIEKKIFLLKIFYEKYFSGIEPIEPMRERDELRRMIRNLTRERIRNTGQAYRFRTLRARMSSYELYWRRNLVLIERGTHPKMKFRADLKAKRGGSATTANPSLRKTDDSALQEKAFTAVYDSYMGARERCGQGNDMSYESVREVLRNQVRNIKSRYRCKSVKFRVSVEDGRAKVTAVPIR